MHNTGLGIERLKEIEEEAIGLLLKGKKAHLGNLNGFLLVAAGIKKGMSISLAHTDFPFGYRMSEYEAMDFIRELRKLCSKAGLECKPVPFKLKKEWIEFLMKGVNADMAEAMKMIGGKKMIPVIEIFVWRKWDSEQSKRVKLIASGKLKENERDRLLGEFYGIPKCCIDAFIKSKDELEKPQEPIYNLIWYKPHKDCSETKALIKKIVGLLEKVDPELLSELTKK